MFIKKICDLLWYEFTYCNILIKNMEFSDLKYKLDDAIKELEENEKEKNARTKVDEITDNLLSPEKSEKKTFFEKLFGWLK